MIRRTVLMVGALMIASVGFASAAHAGSYTPPSSDLPASQQAEQLGQTQSTASVSAGQLPQTGSDSTEDLLRLGIILVAAGGMLAFVARRRSAASRS